MFLRKINAVLGIYINFPGGQFGNMGIYQGGCTVSVDNIFTHILRALEKGY